MASRETVFIGYPSDPPSIGSTLETATKNLKAMAATRVFETWRHIDVPGHFLIDGILDKIKTASFVVMDITRLNFNATFEAGYAMGLGKRVYCTLNAALSPQTREISQLGIFDTLGYQAYSNSSELAGYLQSVGAKVEPAHFPVQDVDRSAPVFLLDTHYKTDPTNRTTNRLKKAKINYRLFDPDEVPRLSALEAYRGVAASIGVVVQLLPKTSTDFELNNLRGAFVAGLTLAMGRQLLMLQEGNDPVPLDYRDLVKSFKKPADVDKHVAEFAPLITDGLQSLLPGFAQPDQSFLAKLDLGSSAAENEANKLHLYFLPTDSYTKALAGDVRIAVGRKGSGKTALFLQVVERVRAHGQGNIVLDLKPEGYQLKRFKEQVLDSLGDAAREHVAAAFWESVLLLELCHKILEQDKTRHVVDHKIFDPYKTLLALYEEASDIGEADFSERLSRIVERIILKMEERATAGATAVVDADAVAALVYKQDIPRLQTALSAYLELKDSAWILFDNIDKGWPYHGVQPLDVLMVRSLLEAMRKIQRHFQKQDININTIVFLRNDVYELLVEATPDRGKESRASLDWTDVDQLKELLRKRFIFNKIDPNLSFDDTWQRICASHVNGEASADYIIERTLMRPRNLITFVNHCKSNAVNLQHAKIQVEDIIKAEQQYSADIGLEIGYEIRDVFPDAGELLYNFLSHSPRITVGELSSLLESCGVAKDRVRPLMDTLLWFSFLGVVTGPDEVLYSYGVFYNMRKLRKLAKDLNDESVQLAIHKAFWPYLEIKPGA